VLAVAGKSEVVLHPTCTLATGVQNPSAADSPRFRLPEKRTVAHGVLVTDVDGDGLLDVVVGASEPGAAEVRPLYVAFGQGDGSMASAPPAATPNLALPRLAVRLDLDAGTFPLAAGDLNDDGKADFVFPGLVAMSAPWEFATSTSSSMRLTSIRLASPTSTATARPTSSSPRARTAP